jgi:hypothetical protein
MQLDPAALVASFVVGSVGFVVFMYGKRQSRFPHMAVGVALMVYPYFVTSVAIMLAIAVVLLIGLWVAIRTGW